MSHKHGRFMVVRQGSKNTPGSYAQVVGLSQSSLSSAQAMAELTAEKEGVEVAVMVPVYVARPKSREGDDINSWGIENI